MKIQKMVALMMAMAMTVVGFTACGGSAKPGKTAPKYPSEPSQQQIVAVEQSQAD